MPTNNDRIITVYEPNQRQKTTEAFDIRDNFAIIKLLKPPVMTF